MNLHTQAKEFRTRGNPLKLLFSKYILRLVSVPLKRAGISSGGGGGAGVYNPISWGNTRVFRTFNILMCIMSLQEGHIQCSVSYIYLTKQLILEVHLAVLVFHKAHFEICHL